jgi:transposase-like protein
MSWPWRLQPCRTRQGFDVHRYTTVFRWVQRYAPKPDKLFCPHLKTLNGSYCVDETSLKVKSSWVYLYHTIDSTGATIDFLPSPTRDTRAATQFFRRVLRVTHAQPFGSLPSVSMLCIREPLAASTRRVSFPRRALSGRARYK